MRNCSCCRKNDDIHNSDWYKKLYTNSQLECTMSDQSQRFSAEKQTHLLVSELADM